MAAFLDSCADFVADYAEILDIVCLAAVGGWAYIVAKRKNRDEVGWLMIAAVAFFAFGLAASQGFFPKMLKSGAFPALGESLLDRTYDDDSPHADTEEFQKHKAIQKRQKNWQKASGFIVGVPAGLLVNLVLTLFLKPLPAPEKPSGGAQPPGESPPSAPPEGGEATTPESAAESAEARGQPPAQSMAAAAGPAQAAESPLDPEKLLRQFWPVLIPLVLFAVALIPPVADALHLRPSSLDPTKDLRFFLLVPVVGLFFWRLRGRPIEGVVAAVFTLLFVPAITTMEWRWRKTDSYYSHGYLVPIVVAALIWRQRERLRKLTPHGDLHGFGLGLLLLGLFVLLAGCFIRMNTLQYIAFVIVIFGLVAFFYGRAITKLVAFPLLFTIAMVPLPMERVQAYTYALKNFAASGSCRIFNTLGLIGVHDYIVERSGSYVNWETATGELDQIIVGDVCSGLRSLIALVAFGALFAYVTKLPLARRLMLFACAVPCALIANMWRIVTLTFIACIWGSDATHGWVHDVTGYGIFAVAFVLFFSLERLLQGFGPRPESGGPSRAPAIA